LGKTVSELLAEISSAELTEWLAYDRIDPLPDPYWTNALLCQTIMRSQGNSKAKLVDFLPSRPASLDVQSADAGLAIFDSHARRLDRAAKKARD